MSSVIPAISVIIPAYKTEKYIGKCLDSLTRQNFSQPYEIIVVNDGSPDDVGKIAESYAEKYEFVRVINKDNGGVSSARNAGLAAAAGEFIAFVDSDDYVQPDYLSSMWDAANDTGADIVCCNFCNVMDSNGRPIKCVFKHTAGVFDSERLFKSILIDITVRSYLWNKLFRRSLFLSHNIIFPTGVKFEDAIITPQLFYYAEKITVIKGYLYNYVRHSDSITGALKKSDVRDYIEYYAALRIFMERENIFRHYRLWCFLLRKKVSVTVFGMLVRCWIKDRKNTHVLYNYKCARKILKVYATDRYYFADRSSLSVVLK